MALREGRSNLPNIHHEMFNPVLLERVVDLRRDGIVVLKMLPEAPGAMPCITAPCYHRVKKGYVLATQLYRSAKQSGISIRGLEKNAQEAKRRAGHRKKGHGDRIRTYRSAVTRIADDVVHQELEFQDCKLAVPCQWSVGWVGLLLPASCDEIAVEDLSDAGCR
jgi:hypothetical protein